jgi:hypothetical protein
MPNGALAWRRYWHLTLPTMLHGGDWNICKLGDMSGYQAPNLRRFRLPSLVMCPKNPCQTSLEQILRVGSLAGRWPSKRKQEGVFAAQ